MNLFHVIANAQGGKAFGFGDKFMARTVRNFPSPVAKTIERCTQTAKGLPPALKFPGSRGCGRFSDDLRMLGLFGCRGVSLRTMTWTLAALAMLSGCSALPVDGPSGQAIVTGASATLANPPRAVVYDYALVDVNPIVLDCLADAETDSFFKTFGGRAPALRIGAGDVLGVSIFEASSGPFTSPAVAAAGANNKQGAFVTIPTLTVASSGDIFVPYAGVVHVAGRTLPEIEREIESRLEKRVVEPQIVLNLAEQNSATATVVGDTGSNKVKLSVSGERILDMISKVGGVKGPASDMEVTLQRKKRTATLNLPLLVSNPEENIYVQPDDVIYVSRNQRKFVAAGAIGATSGTTITSSTSLTTAVGLFSFDQEHLSLNEALGKAGGLLDYRADPAQVFLYRMERRKTLEGMGVDLGRFAPNQRLIPTVYRADFRDPSSFVYAQRFPMRDKDTIYVGNSEATEVSKVFNYLTLWTSTPAQVASNANTVAHAGP